MLWVMVCDRSKWGCCVWGVRAAAVAENECVALICPCCLCLQVISSMNAQALSNIMYAFARLRIMPPDAYMKALLAHAKQLLGSCPECRCQLSDTTLHQHSGVNHWQHKKLGHNLAMASARYAYSQQQQASAANSTVLHLHTCVGSKHDVPSFDHSSCGSTMRQYRSKFQPEGLGMTAYAMAILCVTPDEDWQQRFVMSCYHSMTGCSSHNLVSIVMVLAYWQRVPSKHWLQSFLVACHKQLDTFTAQVCFLQFIKAVACR